MTDLMKNLWKLQKIDKEILALLNEREEKEDVLDKIKEDLDKEKASFDKLKSMKESLEEDKEAKELILKNHIKKVKQWENRLIGIKSTREYNALQREIANAKELKDKLESEILYILEEIDKITTRMDEINEKISELEKELKEAEDKYREKINTYNNKIDQLKKQREDFITGFDKRIIHKYEAIRKTRNGIGVALVVNNICTGCNIQLRPQLANIIQSGKVIETCPNCQRLIIWEGFINNGEE